jgi:hypothetical protein
MINHLAAGGYNLVKRSAEDGEGNVQLPGWAWGVLLVTGLVFLPIMLYVSPQPVEAPSDS